MSYVNKSVAMFAMLAIVTLIGIPTAFAQRDASSKALGEYNFYGNSAGRSMRSAREYSGDYREYAKSAPKVNPDVAREASDSIGQYITKAQKHMASMRKHAAGDKETLASLDSIDKHLAAASKSHADMQETCMKDHVDGAASMECCKTVDDSLAKAIAEHDKLMKRLGLDKSTKK